jgi:hypothetical protein
MPADDDLHGKSSNDDRPTYEMTIAGMVGERMASATGQNDSGHPDTHTILEYSGLPVDEMA